MQFLTIFKNGQEARNRFTLTEWAGHLPRGRRGVWVHPQEMVLSALPEWSAGSVRSYHLVATRPGKGGRNRLQGRRGLVEPCGRHPSSIGSLATGEAPEVEDESFASRWSRSMPEMATFRHFLLIACSGRFRPVICEDLERSDGVNLHVFQ